ncbi:MAG: carboxypeptidase regulatory-like domain-containing protein [Acidobacteria bacterium]|nr:carboxypeptidase regulatory-like domain-containing protein [Acidobacteriota bacterium]
MRHQFKSVLCTLFLALACCLLSSNIARAQEETAATITGQVVDTTGAVIPNATVVVAQKETGSERRVQTSEDGNYSISPLAPGDYTVTVEQTGFKRYLQNITLNARDRRPLEIRLEAGSLSETVTVTDEPSLLQESPTGQTLISGTQVIELPLSNRNFLKLTELVPGVTSGLDDESSFGLTSRADISINGMRRNAVNYLVDGVSNTDVGSNITLLSTPTVDSIKEFKVLTSNYTAEIGRSGGGVVTVVTRGGTNDFHGSLYEFVRNDYFNANRFFNNRQGRRADGSLNAPVPKLRYNNFGGTLSGPVTLPRFGEGGPAVYSGRNKLFFFFSEEVRRITRGSSSADVTVPTFAQRSGDFSSSLGVPLFRQANGTSGTTVTATPLFVTDTNGGVIQARSGMIFRADGSAFAGNLIPDASISPLARSLLPAYPLPNGVGNAFTTSNIDINNTRQETTRIDYNINDNNRLFGRYTHDLSKTREACGLFSGVAVACLPNTNTSDTRVPGHVLAISYTSIISPSLVNEATYNFSGNLIGSQLIGRGRRSDYPGSEAIPQFYPENNNNAVPTIGITGFTSLFSSQGFNIKYTNHVVRDNVTWTRGNHTFKFGGEASFEKKAENASNITQGSFNFDTAGSNGTSASGGPSITLTQTGNAFASFLQGRAASYLEDQVDVTVNLKFGRRELFAQDTWKVRPNLTLDYGVRYQYFVPVTDENNVLTSFDPALFSSAAVPTCTTAACSSLVRGTGNELNGIAVAGLTSRFGEAVSPKDRNNFSPRVGLAYSPNFKSGIFRSLFGENGKSVIRLGYGFYYDQVLVGIFEQNAFVNPPYNSRASFSGSGIALLTPAGGALGALPIRALIANAPDFTTPEVQQWSLGIQRELFKNAVLDVSYVGTKGDHLIRQLNINQPQPADVVRVGTANVNTVRPFIGYGNINYRETSGRSRYHGLLSSFTYRFSTKFSLTAAYTFSKNLADATNDRDAIDEPQNPLNKAAEYAEARTSRPHVFSASYVYELPFFSKSSNAALRHLLGGWQISGITTIASGQPIPRITADSLTFSRGSRADIVGDPQSGLAGTPDPTGLPYIFDPNAFANPAAGTYGNSPRAFLRLPGQNQTNLSAAKNIYFNREKGRYLQLRAESFNVFNHTQFTGIGAAFATPSTFGRPTSTRLPREFQFGLKLYF